MIVSLYNAALLVDNHFEKLTSNVLIMVFFDLDRHRKSLFYSGSPYKVYRLGPSSWIMFLIPYHARCKSQSGYDLEISVSLRNIFLRTALIWTIKNRYERLIDVLRNQLLHLTTRKSREIKMTPVTE